MQAGTSINLSTCDANNECKAWYICSKFDQDSLNHVPCVAENKACFGNTDCLALKIDVDNLTTDDS